MITRRAIATRSRSRAFSLTELMVAVGVLVVVILIVGRIFGTVSRVTAVGAAGNDILQEAASLERIIREDFRTIQYDNAFMAIRFNAVRNDINFGLLNPALPPDAIIRSDQLVFFNLGVKNTQISSLDSGTGMIRGAESLISRIYYGHGYQLPRARPYDENNRVAYDAGQIMYPWKTGPVAMKTTSIWGSEPTYLQNNTFPIDGTQPEARQWALVRQPILLADDDKDVFTSSAKTNYLEMYCGKSIFYEEPFWQVTTPQVRDSRVDIVSQRLQDIRQSIAWNDSNGDGVFDADETLPWRIENAPATNGTQYGRIAGIQHDQDRAIYFPRAERQSPGPDRVDQTLTSVMLGTACSSFRIEWTYADGVGDAGSYSGMDAGNPASPWDNWNGFIELPWFGLDFDGTDTDDMTDTGVMFFRDWQGLPFDPSTQTIDPTNIEDGPVSFGGWTTATAVFGYNRSTPLNGTGSPDTTLGYTPWPTALRITMVLHDPKAKLEGGREVQFIVHLPNRE